MCLRLAPISARSRCRRRAATRATPVARCGSPGPISGDCRIVAARPAACWRIFPGGRRGNPEGMFRAVFGLESLEISPSPPNAGNAGCALRLARADLGRLPYCGGSAGCVLANLPWGQAVQPEGIVRDDIGLAISEILRILSAGGNAVLLMPPADEILDKRCRTLWTVPIRVAGRWTTIYIVAGNNEVDKRPAFLATRSGPSLQRMRDNFGDIAVVGAPVDGAV